MKGTGYGRLRVCSRATHIQKIQFACRFPNCSFDLRVERGEIEMTVERTITQSVRAVAGSVLLGPGLFASWGNLVWAGSRLSGLLAKASGLGLLPSVVLVAPVDQRWLWQSLIRILWPVFLVIAGAMLLSDQTPERSLANWLFFGGEHVERCTHSFLYPGQ
jgi:hypothetical protein